MGIRRIWARIKRIGKGRGFGIQSPADYSFVRNVINEHLPYYAYTELKKLYPYLTRQQRSKCELLFRIANFMQPHIVINIGTPKHFDTYIAKGCKKATIYNNINNNVSEKDRLLILASCDSIQSQKDQILNLLQHGNILVVDDINSSEQARFLWQTLIADSRCTICFDLYDIGIIIADNKRDKAFYAINY